MGFEVLRTAFQTSLVMEWVATAATALVASAAPAGDPGRGACAGDGGCACPGPG